MISIEASALIDEKYFRVYRQTKLGDPEKKLMFAVLLDAMQTYQKFAGSNSFRGKTLFREAEAWFWSEDYGRVFSFANICEVFGLNPPLFRRGLRQLRMNQKKRTSRGKVVQLRATANRPRKLMSSGRSRASRFTLGKSRHDV
jgi:hypothetical protein